MKTPITAPLLLTICLFTACSGNEGAGKKSLDDCPVVATMEKVGNDQVTTLHLERLKDTLDLPVSLLLEDFHLIPLDNRDEALIKSVTATAYGNYIVTGGSSSEPCRLFDRTGKFVCQIGANGQGPGEYWAVYDNFIDETNGRIYLMPWNAKSLLVYDMKGKYLSSIPLPTLVPKGVFTVDAGKKRLTVGLLPFNNIEGAAVVWQQDFEGNVLHRVDAAPYAIEGDYNNEVSNPRNNGGTFDFSIFRWAPAADTLYHFIAEANRLAPIFTLQQPEEPIQHDYMELPGHYLVDIPTGYTQEQYGTSVSARSCVMVDKKTLKGAYVRIINDYTGNVAESAIFFFRNGYFAYTIDPGNLMDQIEAALSHPDRFDEKRLANLKRLQESVSENDNNYLFIGKIKSNTEKIQLNIPVAETNDPPVRPQARPQQATIATAEADSVWNWPPHGAYIPDSEYKAYFRQNNKYADWDASDGKVILVKTLVEKDGSASEAHTYIGADYNKEKNQITNRKKPGSGIPELDQEAERLIRNATFQPGRDDNGNPIRCYTTVFVFFPPL